MMRKPSAEKCLWRSVKCVLPLAFYHLGLPLYAPSKKQNACSRCSLCAKDPPSSFLVFPFFFHLFLPFFSFLPRFLFFFFLSYIFPSCLSFFPCFSLLFGCSVTRWHPGGHGLAGNCCSAHQWLPSGPSLRGILPHTNMSQFRVKFPRLGAGDEPSVLFTVIFTHLRRQIRREESTSFHSNLLCSRLSPIASCSVKAPR